MDANVEHSGKGMVTATCRDKGCTIAVVGVTGSGKSSFIKLLTQDNTIKVGDSLTSSPLISPLPSFETPSQLTCQKRLKKSPRTHSPTTSKKYTLIDTPRFDDTKRDDYDFFLSLTSYLASSYRSSQKLNGILYLRRIIDEKMQGSALRNLSIFKKNFVGKIASRILC